MATPVSGQEYEPILAWTQLLATLQMLKMEISYVINNFFIYQACFFSRLLDIGLILFGVFIDLKCISDHEHGKKELNSCMLI